MCVPLTGSGDAMPGEGEKMLAVQRRGGGVRRGADGKETNGVPVSEVVMCRGKSRSE